MKYLFQDCGDFLCVISYSDWSPFVSYDFIIDFDGRYFDSYCIEEFIITTEREDRISASSVLGKNVINQYKEWKKKKDLLTKIFDNSNI